MLTEPPSPPLPGTWWWDEGRMVGGQVVESQPCEHADACFGGFDLVLAPQPRHEWTPLTEQEKEEGKLPPARLRVCGYDGAPVVTHGPVRLGQRGTIAGVATQEGLRSDRWRGATARTPITPVATSKQFRAALHHSKRRHHPPPMELALQRWRGWAPGLLADNLLRALRQARRLPGLKAKIQQLCIKIMWRRVGLRGPEGPRTCVSCGQGEGAGVAEEHMFFTCPHALEVWAQVQHTVAQSGGVLDPRSPVDLTCTAPATALGGRDVLELRGSQSG